MKCPFCSRVDSKVVDSRDSETGEAIRRRRECLHCGKRFTTYERVEAVPLFVVKKDGRREEFNRMKLLTGLLVSTKKRQIPPAQLEALIEDVEHTLRGRGAGEVPTREVGELVMERLRALDEIAYIRFASVYRSFRDVDEMWQAVTDLRTAQGQRGEGRRRGRAQDGSELPLDLGK